MYGAILGDIVGSPYEFDYNNYKGKDFPLFSQRSEFTDDTVMTLAVTRALLDTRGQDDITIKAALVREMQRLGCAYPDKGYGARFNQWLYEDDPQPYRSYGVYALISKDENRDRSIKKPRPSLRAQLEADKAKTTPKKAAAKSKNHEMEV